MPIFKTRQTRQSDGRAETDEEYLRRKAEYDKALAEYNRKLEEHHRRVAEQKATEAASEREQGRGQDHRYDNRFDVAPTAGTADVTGAQPTPDRQGPTPGKCPTDTPPC